jgi:hypothetical protein
MKTRIVKLILEDTNMDAETSFSYVKTSKSNEEIESIFNKYIKDWENTIFDEKIYYQMGWADIVDSVAKDIGTTILEDKIFTTFKKEC